MKKIFILLSLLLVITLSSCQIFENMFNGGSSSPKTSEVPTTTPTDPKTSKEPEKSTSAPVTTTDVPATSTKQTPSTSVPTPTSSEIPTTSSVAHTHTFSSEWSHDENFHWHDATCSHDVKDSYEPHSFESSVTSDKITYTCTVCGYKTEYYNVINLNSLYAYNLFKETNVKWATLYEKLFAAANEFTLSTKNLGNDDVVMVGETPYYFCKEISYSELGLTNNEATSVWEAFYLENPQFYWLNSHYINNSTSVFLAVDDQFITSSARKILEASLTALVSDVTLALKDKTSELDKVVGLHDYILSHTEYAYKADGTTPEDESWAHSIVGFITRHKGVCESYAKTFIYLSRIFDINNIAVTGSSKNQNHMWNLAQVNNKWYHFDFTWDDNGTEDYGYNYFALNEEGFAVDHVTNTQNLGINYLYPLPAISTTSMELVKLYNDEVYLGMYDSFDSAFEVMSEENDYTIQTINYFARESSTSFDNRKYNLNNTNKLYHSLTILGMSHIFADETQTTYYTPTTINVNENVVLNSNLTLENVVLSTTTNTLKVKNSTLTLKGYVEVNVEILDEAGIIDNYSSIRVSYNKPVTISTMNNSFGRAYITSNANITNLNVEKNKIPVIYFGTANTTVNITNMNFFKNTTTNRVVLSVVSSTTGNILSIDNIVKAETGENNNFTFNVQIEDVANYPDVRINNRFDDIYVIYMIISTDPTAITATDFVSHKILKTARANKDKYLLYINSTTSSISKDKLTFDDDDYLVLNA